jgi:NOL1/NOP2/fmu family ribosome biogenesis protein
MGVAWLSQVLPFLQWGVELGSFKNQDFVPAHALALSTLADERIPDVELELDMALRYLRKENLALDPAPAGWALARYQGLNLGWLKGVKGRINNYFPKEWRIRMASS